MAWWTAACGGGGAAAPRRVLQLVQDAQHELPLSSGVVNLSHPSSGEPPAIHSHDTAWHCQLHEKIVHNRYNTGLWGWLSLPLFPQSDVLGYLDRPAHLHTTSPCALTLTT